MATKLTILGCGGSMGVPLVGDVWRACDPNEPKNFRMRPSIWVKSDTTSIIVDTGQDFRMQTVKYKIETLDAVLYTHAHSDHVNGIDDVRPYTFRAKKQMPAFMNKATYDELMRRFNYVLVETDPLYPVLVAPQVWDEDAYYNEQQIGDIIYTPFPQQHGNIESIGFRFGNIGYSTDMTNLADASIEALKGIDTWIVDGGAGMNDMITVHASYSRVIDLNKRIGAKQVFLTHLTAGQDYQTLLKELPQGYAPAYDGLEFTL
ncbi:MAG: MBL fold metallo-hydrolase [Alphaproteobacteria bacterium]|nr:MBL fold metallo-hydrolase [Alphaproteobacteria bacterium]